MNTRLGNHHRSRSRVLHPCQSSEFTLHLVYSALGHLHGLVVVVVHEQLVVVGEIIYFICFPGLHVMCMVIFKVIVMIMVIYELHVMLMN